MTTNSLPNQDFPCFEGSVLSQELPLPAYNPTNFVVSRNAPSLVFAATLGTFQDYGTGSILPESVVEEQRKKRGFDSQLVLYKLRLAKNKDFIVEKKNSHRFDMTSTERRGWADSATLKESADGSSLIFLFSYRALIFNSQTLEIQHSVGLRVLDILEGTVLLEKKSGYFLSELTKIDDDPKPFSLKTIINNANFESYIQGERFVFHEGKCFSFAVAK